MMNKLISALVVLGLASGLSGCIVHTRGARACSPGYRWTGYRCAWDFQSRRHRYKPNPVRKTIIVRDHR